MNTLFEEADFQLFLVPGLEERMNELKTQLRPKFEQMGTALSSHLSSITGDDTFPHVARHARRKTNPPDDSWVAFSTNPRGYKMMPHFQITVWNTHVLIQWGIIYESKQKEVFASNLKKRLDEVIDHIPVNFQWSKDHMKPEGTLHGDMARDDFLLFSERLVNNKKGEVMVGLPITKEKALTLTTDEFYDLVYDTWTTLNFLHQLAK